MHSIPLNLCVFDSTKGHFGRNEIYQDTITNLGNQIPLGIFANRYVHIKVDPNRPDEKERLASVVTFYESRGFLITVSYGSFKHFDVSHQKAYCLDLIKMYSSVIQQTVAYTLHLESDWLFHPRDKSLIDHLETGMRYLDANPTVLSLRVPRYENEVFRLQSVRAKHGLDVDVVLDESFKPSFYRHNDNISLNPNMFRTRDLWAATRTLELNFDRFGFHAEMGFTHCLRWLSPDKLPYSIYNPLEFNCLHIGTKPGEEDKTPPIWTS